MSTFTSNFAPHIEAMLEWRAALGPGRRSSATPTPATSTGNNTNSTGKRWPPTHKPTVVTGPPDPPGKAPPSCRD